MRGGSPSKRMPALRWVRRLWALLPAGLLLFVAGMAGALNRDYTHIFVVAHILRLARFEAFHIAMHILIFATISVLAGWPLPRGRCWLVWVVVIGGTLLVEGMQIVSLGVGLWPPVIKAAAFDLGVNVLGAGLGMLLLLRLRP